jgi:hypothetical protein
MAGLLSRPSMNTGFARDAFAIDAAHARRAVTFASQPCHGGGRL